MAVPVEDVDKPVDKFLEGQVVMLSVTPHNEPMRYRYSYEDRDYPEDDYYPERSYSCTCHVGWNWENGPCDYCNGDTPCEGGCGEIASECVCDEVEDEE